MRVLSSSGMARMDMSSSSQPEPQGQKSSCTVATLGCQAKFCVRQTGDKIAAVRVNRSVIFLKSRHDAAKAKSMDHSTRRSFLKDLSLGTAAFSVADHRL